MKDLIPLERGNTIVDNWEELMDYVNELWDYNPDCIIDECDWVEEEIEEKEITDPDKICEMYTDAYLEGLNGGLPYVEYFGNPTFNALLFDFLDDNGKNPEEVIRCYLPDKHNRDCFYMQHGIGYAWMSDDLLGGSADGEVGRDFDQYLTDRGFTCLEGVL